MSDVLQTLARRLREARRERGLTLRDLAARAELSPRFLVEVENARGNISVERLARLAGALGLEVAELLGGAGRAPQPPRIARLMERLAAMDDAALSRLEATLGADEQGAAADGSRVVALLGVRGAGKSTVGARVAERTGLPFVELDARVEEAAGLGLSELFAIHGQPYYRRLEHEVLTDFLDAGHAAILATGGSLVTHPESWALLQRRALTVWLAARAEDHWARVVDQGDHRPMHRNPGAFSQLRALLAEREPLYAEADRIVDTSGRPLDTVVEEVAGIVGGLGEKGPESAAGSAVARTG